MGLKEILFGTKEYQQREAELQREVFEKTGISIQKKKGGLIGILTNKPRDFTNSSKLDSPGAGKK